MPEEHRAWGGVELSAEAAAWLSSLSDADRHRVAFYVDRSHEGRDEATLALLRRDCARVFLETARAELDPGDFAAAFVSSLTFAEVPEARNACRQLTAAGLRLAVVSNWDIGLHAHLDDQALRAEVNKPASSATERARQLVESADQKGGSDNCTVLCVRCW